MGLPVWLYVPNVIDYVRVVLLGLSMHYFFTDMHQTLLFYGLSCSMDMIDGLSARLLDQESLLGGVMDMVTDRSTTICMLIHLARLYPHYQFLMGCALYLDILSHWMLMMATFQKSHSNHKQAAFSNALLNMYYKNKPFLTIVCTCAEV